MVRKQKRERKDEEEKVAPLTAQFQQTVLLFHLDFHFTLPALESAAFSNVGVQTVAL